MSSADRSFPPDRETGGPDSATARAVRAIEAAPQRRVLPTEAALSLPVPLLRNGHGVLAFFWVSHGGPANARTVGAPYCRVVVDPSHLADATFEAVAPGSLGVLDRDAPFRPTIGLGAPPGTRKARIAAFHRVSDHVLGFYEAHGDRPERAASESSHLLVPYRRLFEELAIVALRPAYRASSPAFFAWLDAATRLRSIA